MRDLRGPLDRLFDAVASPWTLAAGLAGLAGLHWATAWRLLDPTAGGWTALSARAVACGLIAACAVAQGALHVKRPGAKLRLLGAGLGVLGALTLGALPIFQRPGLAQGGTLTLDARSGAEAAQVELGGVQVKQNLGGLKLEVQGVTLEPPAVSVQLTDIPRGTTDTLLVTDAAPVSSPIGLLSLAAIEPAPEPAGVEVRVTDTSSARTFNLLLRPGAPAKDPAGPGEFTLEAIEATNPVTKGARITGFVTEAEGAEPAPLTLWTERPAYDATHRKGRYAVAPLQIVPGYQARLRVAAPPELDPALIGFALLLAGCGLVVFAAAPKPEEAA